MPRPPELPDFPASQLFLRRLAYSLVHDEARAEDLVQDTWAAWVEHRPSGVAEPKAWLARVLRNRAFNLKRTDARRAQRESFAGRPDPSAPETDGTLEAQARLIEALRELEEPYRSTLVQRYYHDLAPKEIAERSGTPLNTVKARLARGLERLRAAMDKRYRGDRGAWCHWLVSLGNPPVVPVPTTPSAPAPTARPPSWSVKAATVAGASGAPPALLSWMLLAGALLSGVGWMIWRTNRASVPSSPVTFVADPMPAPVELLAPQGLEPRAQPPRARVKERPAPAPESAPPPPLVPLAPPLPFEWMQLAGAATHDNYSAFRERVDLIARPRVAWTQRGFAGQPTISGTELYSGGTGLFRLDLVSGKVSGGGEELAKRVADSRGVWHDSSEDWALWCLRQGLTATSWIAGSPAFTNRLVFARFVGDGSVSAFDRDLARELWHWEPSEPAPCPLSGCLVGDRYLAAHGSEVVSLDVETGAVDWRFETGDAGEVRIVPACDGDLVYFATASGVVLAVDLARGMEEWRTETGRAYGGAYPVVFGDSAVLADDGISAGHPWLRRAELRAFQSYDGRELWHAALDPYSNVGVGEGFAAVVGRSNTVLFSVESGASLANLHDSSRSQLAWNAAAPIVVGGEILDALNDRAGGRVSVRDLASGEVRWSYELGPETAVLDVVHAGDRIYVVTTAGLTCLADEPGAEPAPPGFLFGPGAEARMEREPWRKR